MLLAWNLIGPALPLVAALITYAAGVTIAHTALRAEYPYRKIGWCNAVTLIRLILVCALVASIFADAPPWSVFAIAALAFALDGLDGWLARREGLTSRFGARFDMEVDALLALILACLVLKEGCVDTYVLILGLPRYIFWVLQFAMPWLNGDLPERFSRKVVCVVQIGVLLALLSPIVTSPIADLLAAGAVTALVWSFGLDVRVLHKARR